MESVIKVLQAWQLHPLVNNFTLALLTTALVIDLVASLFSARLWLRYMALTLMVLGTIAAGLSYLTGMLEAQRLGETIAGPAQDVLRGHAEFGQYLMYAFAALMLWRAGLQAFNFLAGSRPAFLILFLIAASSLFWQAHLGADLVYTYGVGTQLMAAAAMGATPATPAASETPALPVAPAPSTTAPTSAAPAVHETPNATATATANSPSPTPAAAEKSPTPMPSPTPAGAATRTSL